MVRVALAVLVLAVLAAVTFALAGDPGRASIDWLGWRIDMSAATALVLLAATGLVFTALWRAILWLASAPARAARARADARRRQAADCLSRGFLAAAAGDGSEARRLAHRAGELADEMPALVRLLTAAAADAAGDEPAMQAAHTAMLGFPEMRLAGHRGLMQLAIRRGDREEASRHAIAAYGMAKTARWAWRAVLEQNLERGDWVGALELVKSGLERKIVTPVAAERARAALLAASAASLEASPQANLRAQALDYAVQAAKLRPGFAPGVAVAARLLAADGRSPRAATLIEQAWKEAPHPALALAYRDLRTDETPRERGRRLHGLAALNPGHRESRLVEIEADLMMGDLAHARAAAAVIAQAEPPTARICALMARLAHAAGLADEARSWIVRAPAAPQEVEWSDIDPQGRAFAYAPADWARLVSTYAEGGELIHPRFERREPVMTELPDLPVTYQTSVPFLTAAETGAFAMLRPDDPGPDAEMWGDPLAEDDGGAPR